MFTSVKKFQLIATLLAASSALAAAPAKAQVPADQSFFDDFNAIDLKRWYVSDGWVNGNHQGCTWARSNVTATNGKLRLRLTKSANALRAYKCAEIRTYASLGYGLYEARIRTVAGGGLNTGMFTYSGPPLTKVHDELDFEFLGKSPNQVQLNYWVNKQGNNVMNVPVPGGAAAAFNNYAMEWAPNSIKWYINGKLVRSETGSILPVTPGQFFLTLWSGSSTNADWLGTLSPTTTSVMAQVEWAAYSAPGTACRFPQSMRCTAP
jgi:endo-1,3-1,4-beta-glycanase ExoK